MTPPADSYGLMAEFEDAEKLVEAARRAHEAGYRRMDAYSPYPVEGLAESLGFRRTWIAPLVLAGGILGGTAGFALQYFVSVIDYPLNIGGRALNSWPAFIPVTFELTILGAALFAVLGMLALNGLPMPYHPVFNVPRFALATRDRFFLVIEARDKRYETEPTRRFLQSLGARAVSDVPQ
jgi:hypothetical protein